MMTPEAYQAKVAARLERLRSYAERKRTSANATLDKARTMAGVIPFGQPIHVGHYSEGADRNYRKRIDRGFTRGFADLDEARKADARADAAEANTSISSDDPEAVTKLRAKLAEAERQHAAILEVNARLRKGATHAEVAPLLDWWTDPVGRLGIWASLGHKTLPTTNSGADMRRIKARISELESAQCAPEVESLTIGAITISECENRVRLTFPGKPDDKARAMLKSAGWRWSPTVNAWQRHATNAARYSAKEIARALDGHQSTLTVVT